MKEDSVTKALTWQKSETPTAFRAAVPRFCTISTVFASTVFAMMAAVCITTIIQPGIGSARSTNSELRLRSVKGIANPIEGGAGEMRAQELPVIAVRVSATD